MATSVFKCTGAPFSVAAGRQSSAFIARGRAAEVVIFLLLHGRWCASSSHQPSPAVLFQGCTRPPCPARPGSRVPSAALRVGRPASRWPGTPHTGRRRHRAVPAAEGHQVGPLHTAYAHRHVNMHAQCSLAHRNRHPIAAHSRWGDRVIQLQPVLGQFGHGDWVAVHHFRLLLRRSHVTAEPSATSTSHRFPGSFPGS